MKANPMATASPAKLAKIQQLITNELGFEIPISRATFGVPQALVGGETFISMRVDASYDERFSRDDIGVTYRRIDLQTYLDQNNVNILISTLPVLLSTLVAYVNTQVPIALEANDFVDVLIEDPTLLAIPITATPDSVLWEGSAFIRLTQSIERPLVIENSVGSFALYTP